MKIYVAGAGKREEHLRALILEKGHMLPHHGPWDMVVLEMPRSSLREELADALPAGQKVVCGITDEAFDKLAEKRGWRLLRILQDEAFAQQNAALTAQGALCAAMNACDLALSDARCLVIGYGRIGTRLTGLLRSLGAKVTVAARRKESRELAGKNSVPIDEIRSVLPHTDLIFNTVPASVLNRELLNAVSSRCLLMELAGKPYGIDLEAARAMGLKALLESGVPGRYFPRSAARAMLQFIERIE